jgi:uncharacterized protein
MVHFEKRLTLPIKSTSLFTWHERQGAFERLCPPWDPVEIMHKDEHIKDGAQATLRVRGPLGIPLILKVIHEGYVAGEQFVDRQVKGPFKSWKHTHQVTMHEDDHNATLTDSIEYTLPLGPLGELGGGGMVKHKLSQLFHYRHEVMKHDHLLHHFSDGSPLHFAISGASGLIGSSLQALLTTGGHRVTVFSRSPGENTRVWQTPDAVPNLEDIDIVIHLAGESVAERWHEEKKRSIMESRVLRTRALSQSIADLKRAGKSGPKALICASGIGYYGDQSPEDHWVDETSSLGQGFLADVCKVWEEACQPARDEGIRVVNARIGVVLTPQGGALGKLLLPFSLGLGGPVSHGRQWMSWIGLHDVVGALYFLALKSEITGPVNLSAPKPVTNRTFSKILGRVLRRPAIFPIPAFILKAMFGEMAKETILSGQRVEPKILNTHSYPFMHENLEDALRFELGRVNL